MKKFLAMILAGAMALSLAACGGSNSAASTPAPAPSAPAQTETPAPEAPAEASYKVGICQFVQHPALDAATQGFKDAIIAELGDSVQFVDGNAAADIPTCATIIDGFLAEDVDLIMANATPPLQAAASATNTIPVLGTSVTDYATALEIDNWTGTVGNNISGTSDLAPLDQQAAMLAEMFPDAKNVGLIYCTAEANSVYQIEVITGYLEELGYTCTKFAFNDSNDVASVSEAAAEASDVIYIPTDNTAASNTEAIANVLIPAGVPAVVGEEGICSGCGVATLSISYYDLGFITGQQAVAILRDGADVSQMPIEFAPNVVKEFNADNCNALGITPPEDYVAIGA